MSRNSLKKVNELLEKAQGEKTFEVVLLDAETDKILESYSSETKKNKKPDIRYEIRI